MKSESSKSNYLNESELLIFKMFYKVKLEHAVTLEPRHFGPKLFDVVKRRLYEEVEGKCFDTHGMIIAVIEIEALGDGFLFSGEAGVTFHVTFRALVARPFRDQVVDGNVSMVRTSKPKKQRHFHSQNYILQVTKVGIFVNIGPFLCFVSRHQLRTGLSYNPKANPPCYKSDNGDVLIQEDDEVRVRITGVAFHPPDRVSVVGTMIGDYIGIVNYV